MSNTSSFYFHHLLDACICIRLNHSAVLFNEILQTILCPEKPKNESEVSNCLIRCLFAMI